MADVAELLGTIRNNGELKASVQIVPNSMTGKKRVEVYDPVGRLLAHQTLDGTCTNEEAGAIAFALYNGFVFGVEHIKYKMRKNFEAFLVDTPTPDEVSEMVEPKPEE